MERRLNTESRGGPQDAPKAPYNAEHLIHFGAIAIRERIVAAYGPSGNASAAPRIPHTVCDWADLLASAGVEIIPVRAKARFTAELVRDERAGWFCFVNCFLPHQRQRHTLCEKYCERLMACCSLLGQGCPEAFDLPNEEIRARIAGRVADGLYREDDLPSTNQ